MPALARDLGILGSLQPESLGHRQVLLLLHDGAGLCGFAG